MSRRSRQKNEDQHRIILETATDAVISIDSNSQILFVNSATTRTFGYAASELIGQPLTTLIPECMRAAHTEGFQRYKQSGQRHCKWDGIELIGLRSSGEEFPIEVSFSELVIGGQRIFTGFIRDISERKRTEKALLQSERRGAEEALRAQLLQETDKLQRALLNSISHDLRTPLSAVIGALDGVLEEQDVLDAFTQRDLLKTARNEARHLNRLLQNLLNMTRLEGDAMHLNTEHCDMQDVIGAALEQLAEVARHRHIVVSLTPALPFVQMDFVLIVQVVVNLLENAIKYSADATPIEVEVRIESGQLQVRISDHGNGIPEDDIDRVFEKFYRGASPGASGTGLGLSICRGLVEAHGGRIWMERRPEAGTVATFTLPAKEATEQTRAANEDL